MALCTRLKRCSHGNLNCKLIERFNRNKRLKKAMPDGNTQIFLSEIYGVTLRENYIAKLIYLSLYIIFVFLSRKNELAKITHEHNRTSFPQGWSVERIFHGVYI